MRPWLASGALALAGALSSCGKGEHAGADAGAPVASASASAVASAPAPEPTVPGADVPEPTPPPSSARACPPEMMHVPGVVCIDRWEAHLVDKKTNAVLSPYYPPTRKLAVHLEQTWEKERFTIGGPAAQATPVPPLPAWQHQIDPEPMAVSKPGVTPNGYVSGVIAERACQNAGKRLCKHDEWLTACQGQEKRQFPYGESYKQGACNIFRGKHPAMALHDNPSIGHLDPRLNLVKEGTDPLLRPTAATATCRSVWGDDAAYDLNGNIDEWVEDEKGRFVGGFFSRSKRDGCLSSVRAHGKTYFDYSTGVRCCRDPEAPSR